MFSRVMADSNFRADAYTHLKQLIYPDPSAMDHPPLTVNIL